MGELRYQNLRDPPAHLREQETPHSTQTSLCNTPVFSQKGAGREGEDVERDRERTGKRIEML